MRRWRNNTENPRAERWKREDEAPRLKAEVPKLLTLRFELDELHDGHNVGSARCIRHIIVEKAAALFEIPCTDSKCEEGGHDITQHVLHELRAAHKQFSGEDACRGMVGSRDCGRVLRFTVRATLIE